MDLINLKLTSPNYPEVYNRLEHCTWTITAPQGHYVTLGFEIIDVSTYIPNKDIGTISPCQVLFFLNVYLYLNLFIFNSLALILMVITYQ